MSLAITGTSAPTAHVAQPNTAVPQPVRHPTTPSQPAARAADTVSISPAARQPATSTDGDHDGH